MNKTNEKKSDVVCGMELNPTEVEHTSEYKGEKYYFCSENCKDHFDKDPEKYAGL
jgi:YHS domain-containing protein